MGLIVGKDDEITIVGMCYIANFARCDRKKLRKLTAVKHKSEFDEFHIYNIRVQWFVSETHADMFQFDDIPLKGVLQSVLKIDEIRNLSILLRGE